MGSATGRSDVHLARIPPAQIVASIQARDRRFLARRCTR